MWCYQVSSVMLITALFQSTSSLADLPNQKNLYQFGYTVKDENTRDFKTHREVHDGKEVRGMYSLSEPNGDLRVVTYTADGDNGFRAAVKVHPFGSPEFSKIFSDAESSGQESDHTLIKQTINKESKNNNFQETSFTSPPTGFINSINVKTSEPEINLKGIKLKQNTRKESINNDALKSGQTNPLYNSQGENEQVMILDNDHVPTSDYVEDHGLFRQNPDFSSEKKQFLEPQIIPVKIQDDPSVHDSELLESESNIEMSTFYPSVNKNTINETVDTQNSADEIDEAYSSTKLTDVNLDVQGSSNLFQIDILDQELHQEKLNLDKEEENASLTEDNKTKNIVKIEKKAENITVLIKPNNTKIEMNLDQKMEKKPGMSENIPSEGTPLIDTSLNNHTYETIEVASQEHLNKTKEEIENTKISTGGEVMKNNPLQHLYTPSTQSGNKQVEVSEFKHDKVPLMLAALLVPTPSVLQLTCSPSKLEKGDVQVTPAVTHQTRLQTVQNRPEPLYPFQLVHFSPMMSQHLNAEGNKQFSIPTPMPTFSRRPQSTFGYNTFMDDLRTTMPHSITYSYPTSANTVTTAHPQQTLTRVGSEVSTHPSHKFSQFSQYSHHFLPPPWAPHPFRSTHTSHRRQMPIFVFPMSHNSNFAPTFNPSLQENFN